ncbi:LLM class flavin-dependent oxidoreductase [Halocatena salina]|uniref:LLM class flavin-dependent oxidoreductase n=1 Tax=Halocatena salina TaxID=2934340 RepID=A0A8U0A161_9EURY|nr:LLM class flavin-dependent oxidoreductase [Halocatena salina]UPM42802.1 LLM class flavin-dependent oxidoreductase [Halocatena salina]
MEIGTGLFTCQRRSDDDRSMSEIYEEMLELGRAIDDADLASAWVSEHHFESDGYLSATMPALGALATVTETVEIGSCVALAPLYDPVRLAEDAATVDLLADGRLTLGLAIGSNPREFEAFGVSADERVDRLTDAMQVIRSSWSDGPIDYESKFHDVAPDVTVTPKPDREIPIMLGGGSKPAVRRAARIGDAWCAPSALSLEQVQTRVDDIREVREKEDIDGEFTIYVLQHGFVGDPADDKATVWERMKDGYLYLHRRYAEIFSGDPVSQLPAERRSKLKDRAIYGTPEQVTEELERYRVALGDDVHFILRTYHPGIGTDVMRACIERLGRDVAPRFQ